MLISAIVLAANSVPVNISLRKKDAFIHLNVYLMCIQDLVVFEFIFKQQWLLLSEIHIRSVQDVKQQLTISTKNLQAQRRSQLSAASRT